MAHFFNLLFPFFYYKEIVLEMLLNLLAVFFGGFQLGF